MEFKYTARGFSNYLFAKGDYVIRKPYVTKHLHYKNARIISFDKNDRIYLWSDKGKKERMSKRILRNFLIETTPVNITMLCQITETPF